MAFLTSVYYPTEAERQEMNDLVAEEAKVLKAEGVITPSDRGLTHGGLLLALGRLWRSHPEIKALVRGAYGPTEPGEGGKRKPLTGRKDRPRKRPLNAKSAKVRN